MIKILDAFYFISGVQTFIVILIFFFYKSKKIKINKYLGLFFITMLIEIIFYFLFTNNPSKLIFVNPLKFNLLTTPLLLLYVVKLSRYKLKKIELYLIPSAIEFLFFLIIFIIVYIDENYISNQSIKNILKVYTILSIGFNIFICIKIIHVTNLHRKFLPLFYTNTKNKSLNWVTVFCVSCIIFNVFTFLTFFLLPPNKQTLYILYFLNIVLLYYLSIASVIQININNYVKITNSSQGLKNNAPINSELIEIFNKVESYISDERLYLNPNITLKTLSKLTKISSNKISKSLKAAGYENFNSYINNYRIEEVKKMLLSDSYKKYSIITIAKEVGFNSKATFYKNFKERLGVSPSDYIKQNE
jgi:AraC-like DNA-binding protein